MSNWNVRPNLKLETAGLKAAIDRHDARLAAATKKPDTSKPRYRIVRGRLTLVKAGDA
jgi:hypothetical protein